MRGRSTPGRAAAALAVAILVSAGIARQEPDPVRGAEPAAGDEPAWELGPPAPAVPLRPARLARAGESACAECHAAIVEEWSTTAHALAWVDEVYQEELADRRRPELCHGCHVPEPLLAGGSLPERPTARAEAAQPLDLGVSCEACHLGPDGVILGPRGAPTEAHPTRASPLLAERSSELCAACHATNIGPVIGIAKDFEKSGQAARGRSCAACHLAEVEQAFAEGAPARSGRSHAVQTPRDPAFARRAFLPSLVRADGGLLVRVANGAGHRVPGLMGREFRLRAEGLDAGGAVVARAERTIDARAYLPVDASVDLALEGAGVARARLVIEHLDPRAEEAIEVLSVELDPR